MSSPKSKEGLKTPMHSMDVTAEARMHSPSVGSPEATAPQRVIQLWQPTRTITDEQPRTYADRARRVLNVAAALVILILTAPLMLILALLVKLSSPGPVFYVQPRVGLDRREGFDRRTGLRGRSAAADGRREGDTGGKVFRIYKFRTMRVEENPTETWACQDDPRITGIGKVLRKYRLDELPQVINVLKGDMNLVGPRPEQPKIFSELREKVDQYPERQKVLPGITGWAQINHSYDQNLDDVKKKVDLDLEYLEGRSVLKDLWIMVKTIPVMLFKRGSM